MKLIDKFLKKLKTDRNTFATYVLTLISIYICVDRITEVLFIMFSGLSVDYWGPIKYTFAYMCPIFAFYFSYASKFVPNKNKKIMFLYVYASVLYIIFASMVVQWVNHLGWLLLFSVPNYPYIITNFMDLIKPAFSSFAWYVPVCSFYPLIKWLYLTVGDTLFIRESIGDYGGIDLSDKTIGMGPYTCEMFICKDKQTGKSIYIPEARRFESTLIIGVSGSGKTSMIYEPMIARDIEKKFFYRETAKELGYTALKTNIATLDCPYSNDYINSNFSLAMLKPKENKERVFRSYFSKLTYNYESSHSVYKDLGITYLAPDIESINHVREVADNFGIKYNLIDPNDVSSIGINPFTYDDPMKTSIAISSIIKRLYFDEYSSHDEAFMRNIVTQAIENLVILLKEVYPREHEGLLPNLEDLLEMINDFSKIEEMAEAMKKYPDLVDKYKIQLGYFKKTFYSTVNNTEETAKFLQATAAQLENLLRFPGVRNILCNRTNNINYDNALKNGEVTLVCTRRGDLGPAVHKGFGLFFILLMQQSVLSRPGNEKTRIPHFFYIDEFPPFSNKATSEIFTLYRKYRVGTIISAQNLAQLGSGSDEDSSVRQTILANCTTKIVFGNNTPEDNAWWEKEFGEKRRWTFNQTYDTAAGKYDPRYGNTYWSWVPHVKAGRVQQMKFKGIEYKTKDLKGTSIVGGGKVDFLESRYKEKQNIKTFNFSRFSNNQTSYQPEKNDKFDLKKVDFKGTADNPNDTNPIKYNNSGASYKFDDENAITSYNQNNNKNNNSANANNE